MKTTNNLRGAALALTGVAAAIVAETTGSKKAQKVYDKIDTKFREIEGEDYADPR